MKFASGAKHQRSTQHLGVLLLLTTIVALLTINMNRTGQDTKYLTPLIKPKVQPPAGLHLSNSQQFNSSNPGSKSSRDEDEDANDEDANDVNPDDVDPDDLDSGRSARSLFYSESPTLDADITDMIMVRLSRSCIKGSDT